MSDPSFRIRYEFFGVIYDELELVHALETGLETEGIITKNSNLSSVADYTVYTAEIPIDDMTLPLHTLFNVAMTASTTVTKDGDSTLIEMTTEWPAHDDLELNRGTGWERVGVTTLINPYHARTRSVATVTPNESTWTLYLPTVHVEHRNLVLHENEEWAFGTRLLEMVGGLEAVSEVNIVRRDTPNNSTITPQVDQLIQRLWITYCSLSAAAELPSPPQLLITESEAMNFMFFVLGILHRNNAALASVPSTLQALRLFMEEANEDDNPDESDN